MVTKMIVAGTHGKLHHCGVNITVMALLSGILDTFICQCVNGVLRQCVPCRKLAGKPYKAPDPPPLPKSQVTEAPPFTVMGVDFTGALYVRESVETTVYRMLIFACIQLCCCYHKSYFIWLIIRQARLKINLEGL